MPFGREEPDFSHIIGPLEPHADARPLKRIWDLLQPLDPLRYCAGLLAAEVALWVALPLIELAPASVFALLYLAVLASALMVGAGPALLATAFGGLWMAYFILPPVRAWAVDSPNVLELALFLTGALLTSIIVGSCRGRRVSATRDWSDLD